MACRDLSHMLAEEKLREAPRGTRPAMPLYNANVAGGSNTLKKKVSGYDFVSARSQNYFLGVLGDRNVYYESFRHPFVKLEEITRNYASVHKEYAPNSTEMCTYPMLHFGSQEFHCPWIVRHSGPENMRQPLIPTMSLQSKPVLVPLSDKNRVAKTLQRLLRHRAPDHHNATKVSLRGLGRAPMPPLATPGSKVQAPPERPRPGFCECCYEKYSHLERHLSREPHRRLVCSGDFYRCVDRVLITLSRPSICCGPSPEEENYSQSLLLSPAKSVASTIPMRVKSIPLKNITNCLPSPLPVMKPTAAPQMDVVDVGSDSPIYSSPSLKRRRSQRLVGRPRTGKLVL